MQQGFTLTSKLPNGIVPVVAVETKVLGRVAVVVGPLIQMTMSILWGKQNPESVKAQ